MVNPILARLQQHIAGERRGEYLGRAVPRLLQPLTASANLLGLVNEGADKVAETAAGEAAYLMALPVVAARSVGEAQDTPMGLLAEQIVRNGPLHPGQNAQLARHSSNPLVSWSVGGLQQLANPLNFVGGVGRAGTALEAAGKAPLLARALKAAALTGEGVNRASILPLYLSRKGLERLIARPDWLDDAARVAAPAARQAVPAIAELLQSGEARQAAKEATTFNAIPVRSRYGGVPGRYGPTPPPPLSVPGMTPTGPPPSGWPVRDFADVPSIVGSRADYDQAAKRVGLGVLPKFEPQVDSPLAPTDFSLIRAARERAKAGVTQLPLKAAPAEAALPEKVAAALDIAPVATAPKVGSASLTALPEFGGIADRAGLDTLGQREIDTLVDLAYPHENALNNAMAKYTDDAALAGAAWDRVTKNPDLLQRLMSIDEPLARKLALLPERAGAALPDATPQQLDELIGGAAQNVDIPSVRSGAREAFDRLIASRDDGKMGAYLPAADFFAKRLGIPIEEAQSYIDELVANGTVGDAMGTLAFKPGRAAGVVDEVAQVVPETITPSPLDLSRDDYIAQQVNSTTFSQSLPENLRTNGRRGVQLDRDIDRFNAIKEQAGREWDKANKAAAGERNAGLMEQAGNSWKLRLATVVKRSGATTPEEIATVTKQHREAIAAAIKANKIVPDAVLQDHAAAIKAERAAKAAGGDIAAGGGGMGLLGYPGGINGPIGRAIIPASASGIAGMAVGAGVGAATDDEDRLGGALKGAGIGAGVGFGLGGAASMANVVQQAGPQMRQALQKAVPDGSLLTDDILADVVTVVQRARDEAGLATGPKGLGERWKAFASQWSRQVVDTPKQLPQDALFRSTVMEGTARKEFPGLTYEYVRSFQPSISRERATGAVSLDNPYNQILIATGHPELIGKKGDLIGSEFVESATGQGKRFGRGGSALAGAVIGFGAGVKRVNPITIATGAIRGAVDLEWSTAIRHLIGTANDSFREAMGTLASSQELARVGSAFLDDLETRGVDVAALRARNGMFAPVEVRAIAGADDAAKWATLSEGAIRKAGDRVAFLTGDFRDKLAKDYTGKVTTGDRILGTVEKTVGKVVPFVRWQIRSAPVLAEIARSHPRAAAVLAATTVAGAEQGKEERLKNYQWGTVPITDETPGVGLIARARLGGQKGTTRIDPLGAFSPYGPDTLGGEELPENATGYQKVTNAAGRLGFRPNPLIQSLAYVTGQDYKAPSALSRTSGLEGLADAGPILLRGMLHRAGNDEAAAAVPDLSVPSGRAVLDAGRELLSPVTGAGVPESDPETRRYAELVLQRTGKPLSDPSNTEYAETIGKTDNDLWQLAVLQSRFQGAAGNAVGMVSPVATMAQTPEAVATQQAGTLPWTSYEISQATPSARLAMERENAAATAKNPAMATYVNISGTARRRALMADWEAKHARMKQSAPAYYAQLRKQYMESLP